MVTPLVWWVWYLPLLLLYFLPAVMAFKKVRINRVPILWVNVIFGWSVLGWFLVLVWALGKPTASLQHGVRVGVYKRLCEIKSLQWKVNHPIAFFPQHKNG